MHDLSNGHLFVISGPSGVGKDAVLNTMLASGKYRSLGLHTPRSYTTRPRRENESNNNYIFVSRDEFSSIERSGGMYETSVAHGEYYGMSKKDFEQCLADGYMMVKVLDQPGAINMKKQHGHDVTTIYLVPPDMEELRRRLEKRGTEDTFTLARRMEDSREEMRKLDDCGYDFVVTNNHLGHTAELVIEIIDNVITEKKYGYGVFGN